MTNGGRLKEKEDRNDTPVPAWMAVPPTATGGKAGLGDAAGRTEQAVKFSLAELYAWMEETFISWINTSLSANKTYRP